MMDVEAAEYKILKSINYNEVDISQIIFEKKHFDETFSENKKTW